MPPPPLDVTSRGSRAVTAGEREALVSMKHHPRRNNLTSDLLNQTSEHCAVVTVLICKAMTKLGSVDLGFGAHFERCRRRFGGVSIYPSAPFNLPGPRGEGCWFVVRFSYKRAGYSLLKYVGCAQVHVAGSSMLVQQCLAAHLLVAELFHRRSCGRWNAASGGNSGA